MQESFLSLWRSGARYDRTRGSVRTWVLGIVHNRSIDWLRRSVGHDRRRAGDEGIEERFEAPERTDVEVARRDEAREIRAALDELPDEQSRVIELAFYGGYTHSEIAELLDTPIGTIKGRMRLGHGEDAPDARGLRGGGGVMSTHEELQRGLRRLRARRARRATRPPRMRAHLEECPLCRRRGDASARPSPEVLGARRAARVGARRSCADACSTPSRREAALFAAASRPRAPARTAPAAAPASACRRWPAAGVALALGIVLGALVIAPGERRPRG